MDSGTVNMPATVYLVEDSQIIRRLLTEALEESGAKVVGCTDSAHKAIEAIAVQRPDAVIVDVMLREGSGFDVLRALTEGASTPLRIVLTNYTAVPFRRAAKALGVEYFLDKATQLGQVIAAVASLRRPNGAST
jgi:two-component system response regulator MprA